MTVYYKFADSVYDDKFWDIYMVILFYDKILPVWRQLLQYFINRGTYDYGKKSYMYDTSLQGSCLNMVTGTYCLWKLVVLCNLKALATLYNVIIC